MSKRASRVHDRRAHVVSADDDQSVPDSQDETLDMYFSAASVAPVHQPVRRPVRPLPPQLAEHCTAGFEEAIFTTGIAFLSENLASGLDIHAPAYVPSSQHLALVATLVVHPALTTRTQNQDHHAGSDAALRYLLRLVKTVEVKDSGLRSALRFEPSRNTKTSERSKRARTRPVDGAGVSDDEEGSGTIRSAYAGSKSLWTNAGDFWAVVGWAFHCSARHKARWERWKGWLDLMLDAIYSDLEKTYSSGGELAETLIAQYLSHLGVGRGDKRRVMRAITADGSTTQFGEIWRNETKPPKKVKDDVSPTKRRKLDLENGQYGDYLDESDDSSQGGGRSQHSRSIIGDSTRRRRSGAASRVTSADEEEEEEREEEEPWDFQHDKSTTEIDDFGGMESIRLRQRFIAVLTRFSRIVTKLGKADSLFMDTEDLFDLFTEFLTPLPLQVFQQFVLPLKPYLTVDLQASFNENLCCPLLGSNVLTEQMTQEHFAMQFAPKRAIKSTVVDNAKLSLLLESLLRALWKNQLLAGDSSNLRKQVERGIEARNQKLATGAKRKASTKAGNDEDARVLLQSSAERMRTILNIVAVEA